ncbi:hypothetical protein Tco_0723342 [Tanacetum coccineum]
MLRASVGRVCNHAGRIAFGIGYGCWCTLEYGEMFQGFMLRASVGRVNHWVCNHAGRIAFGIGYGCWCTLKHGEMFQGFILSASVRKMPQACFFFVSAYFGQFHRPVSFSILTRIAVAAKIAGILARPEPYTWRSTPLPLHTVVTLNFFVLRGGKVSLMTNPRMPSSWRGNLTHVTAAAKNGVWFAQTMSFYVAWAFVSFLAEYIYNAVGYADFINPTSALDIQRQPYNDDSQEQMRNRHSIELLLNVNPQHYKVFKTKTHMTMPPPAEIVQEKSLQTSIAGNKNEPSPSTKGTKEALQAMAEERKKKVKHQLFL